MAKLTVTEAAELVGVSRQTIYRKLRDGTLSRSSDKRVDLSELMRVFPQSEYDYVTPADKHQKSHCDTSDINITSHSNSADTAKDELIEYLQEELKRTREEKAEYWDMLKKERERADTLLAALPNLTKKDDYPWWVFWK